VVKELNDTPVILPRLHLASIHVSNQVGKLERAKRQLSSENEELKKSCYLLGEAQRKSKRVALEWQKFGKYTAAVLKNEVETFECKLRVLQEQLDHLTGSHLQVAVEGRKLANTVHFTSYKAVACRRRQSCDGK